MDVNGKESLLAQSPFQERSVFSTSFGGIGCPISDPGGDKVEDKEEEKTAVFSAHDDGCGPVIVPGHTRWGSEWDGEGDLDPVCRYGFNQTRPIGPDNPEAL